MTKKKPEKSPTSSGTVARTIQVLRFVADNPRLTIKEMASQLGLAPSTCHRLLELLTHEGIIEQIKHEHAYRTGAELYRIAAKVMSRYDERSIALPFMREIVDVCDETCVLNLYIPSMRKMFFAEKVDSSCMLRYQLPMNVPLSAMWGASSRAFLAFLPASEVDAIYASETAAPGSGEPLPTRKALERNLETIRMHGFAVTRGQKVPGAVGIVAPVFRAGQQVIGSLGVTVPEIRIGPSDIERLGKLIRQKAQSLSAALGAKPTDMSKYKVEEPDGRRANSK